MNSAAVIVGVDDYEEKPLSSAVNDALAFRDTLISLGLVTADRVQLLTAPVRPDSKLATKKNIKDALWEYYVGIAPADRLYLYFAGHGMTVYADAARALARTVIVPTDVRNLDRDGENLIDVNEIVERFRMVGPDEQFFLIDACRDLPFEKHPDPGSLGWVAADPISARKQAVLYAVSPLGQALGEEGGLGAFTTHLIDALHGRGVALEYSAERDEYFVTIQSVRAYVRAQLEPLLAQRRMWERQYMLPELHAPDPQVSELRMIHPVEPATLTVHIDPDAAAAGTHVHLWKSRTMLQDRSWPPTKNHSSVLLEPQWHKLEVASDVGMPEPRSLPVDLRQVSEVTIRVAGAGGASAVIVSDSGISPSLTESQPESLETREAPSESATSEQAVWSLSIRQIREKTEPAADLLTLFAFLAPEDIPLPLLVAHADVLPEPLASTLSEPTKADELVGALREYWLVRSAGDALFVHRRVQAMVFEGLDETRRRRWAESSVRLMEASFPPEGEDVRVWPTCGRLLPHSLVAASRAEDLQVVPETAASLLSAAALFLNARAQYPEAKRAIDRALALDLNALGPDHPSVARDRNYNGRILRNLDKLDAAQKEYEQALAINEQAHGVDHPSVATDLVGLGRVLLESGHPEAAKPLHERALAIDLAADPQSDARIARDLVMLGRVLYESGDLEGAIELYEQGIARDEAAHGNDHPEVATDLIDLGRSLLDRLDYAGATARFEQALAIDQAWYGQTHPSVARDLAELGRARVTSGDLEGARSLLEQALAIDEKAYGKDHRSVARDRKYLRELFPEAPVRPG